MMHITIFLSLFIMLLATSGPALGQGIPGCYPPPFPATQPCAASRPAPPITRTVQVDVPVPCPPVGCSAPMPYPAYPCGPPACASPCPTRPVEVRIDVRVRPEPCGQKPPIPQGCLDLGPMRPVVELVAATMAVPIRVLEMIFPGSVRCTPPRPILGPPPVVPPVGCPPPVIPQVAPGTAMPLSRAAAWRPTSAAALLYTKCDPPSPYERFQGAARSPQRAASRPVYRPFPHAPGEGFHGSDGSQPSYRGGYAR
jgi:hypothetical protein